METITEGEATCAPQEAAFSKTSFAFADDSNPEEISDRDEEQGRMPATAHAPSASTLQTSLHSRASVYTNASYAPPRRRRTSAMMFEEIQKEHQDSILEKKQCAKASKGCGPFYGGSLNHPGCPHCADRDRDHVRQFRQLAQDYPNIYSWICVNPEGFCTRWPMNLTFLFLGVSVQVVTPIAIALQFHSEIPDEGYCRHWHREHLGHDLDMGRYLSFTLAFYFGVVSIHNFLGKVKGNAFLMIFSSISATRKAILVIGFLAQLMGLVAANVAEYFLFVSRGREDFLLLLFTSTTMQATLNADSNNLISITHSTQLEDIVSKILSDECLNLGEKGDPDLPKDLVQKLIRFRFAYDAMTFLLFLFVFFLTGMVTHCI